MSTDANVSQKSALEFKSTSINIPTLLLINNNLEHIEHQVQQKVAQAPEFFKQSPLLIDLQEVNKKELPLNLRDIVGIIKTHRFIPVGIRGGNEEQQKAAYELNLPSLAVHVRQPPPNARKKVNIAPPAHNKDIEQPEQTTDGNKLILHPIRSGQRVYAKGDLIIAATVSAGSEIMAEGNIHVYGKLRGRALAGVQGHTQSRIFCFGLEAELISIAGNYKVSAELDDSLKDIPVQIYLDGQALVIKPI